MTTSAALLEAIRSRGHWRTLIRPRPRKLRVSDIDDLLPILRSATVEFKHMWPFPVILPEQVTKDLEFIEQRIEANHHLELLRFYQSGQFLHYSGFGEDWRDRSEWWPPDEKWKHGDRIGIGATILQFTQVFEFAAKLASTAAGGEVMAVAIEMHGIGGRHFYVDSQTRFDAWYDRRPTLESFPYSQEIGRAELMASPRKYAIEGLVQLFKRVPSAPSLEILRKWQDEFTNQ